jgi:hypothetical protein
VISLVTGFAVETIDEQYGLTQKICLLIESYLSQVQEVSGNMNDADSSRHDKGEFYTLPWIFLIVGKEREHRLILDIHVCFHYRAYLECHIWAELLAGKLHQS